MIWSRSNMDSITDYPDTSIHPALAAVAGAICQVNYGAPASVPGTRGTLRQPHGCAIGSCLALLAAFAFESAGPGDEPVAASGPFPARSCAEVRRFFLRPWAPAILGIVPLALLRGTAWAWSFRAVEPDPLLLRTCPWSA